MTAVGPHTLNSVLLDHPARAREQAVHCRLVNGLSVSKSMTHVREERTAPRIAWLWVYERDRFNLRLSYSHNIAVTSIG